MTHRYYWRTDETPAELQPLLRSLGEEYPLREGRAAGQGLQLRFEPIKEPGTLRVLRAGQTALIQYAAPALAARALGCLWAGAVKPGRRYEEQTPFKTLGLMPDCSRNCVLTVVHFKKWLRRCALLGYNQAMLYTEDVYEMPGEPYFGYMRGAYTEAELREIDAYAAGLGIEMVACIQTLGHLAHALRWPAYAKIADSRGGTLLTLEPATYALIDKMLAHWARVFRSRRIAVGMDEAVDIGKGRGSDRFGPPRPPAELYFNHLRKVAALCEKRGLKPIIWSDLVFWVDTPARGFGDAYYDFHLSPQQARKIRARLPKNVELGYWDYSGNPDSPSDPEPYIKRIKKHRALGCEPIMCSGIHAWSRLWHDMPNLTAPRVAACVKACRKTGVKELLMTIWTGLDGVDLDSAWAGLAYTAEQAFFKAPSPSRLERRYRAIFGADYQASVAGALDIWWAKPPMGATAILWDDPLLGMFLRSLPLRDPHLLRRLAKYYGRVARRLNRWRGEHAAGDMDHVRNLAEYLGLKAAFSERLQIAYARKSAGGLRQARRDIRVLRRALEKLRRSFRTMWLRQFKPFGLEIMQIRLAGQAERWLELDRRLGALLDGSASKIDELEVAPLPFKGGVRFTALASGSMLF